MDKSNHNAAAWTILALNLVESLSLAATNLFSQPNLTMCVFLPASFFAGRFELVSTPVGIIVAGGLVGLAYVSGRKFKKTQAKYQGSGGDQGSRAPPPLWDDSTSSKKEDNKDTFRKRAESVEWLNQFVRHVWLRYPNLVGDWLIRDVILGEILEGLRRDKVLPAGPIKDILCTKVILRDASPWVLDAEVNPTRSPDELQLMARVRFVSDQDTGVELKIKVSAGIVIPVKIEQISVETRLILRFYLQDEAPFIRVIWLSMMEKPTLDLAILPLGGVDVMKIPGLDTMIHDIIMQGIMSEIVLPAGKIIALKPKMPDEYYKEWGNIPSALDEYSGEMILNISQTRVMLHPAFRENDDMDLYIRVSVDGKQVHRSHKILNTVSETGNFRFNPFVPLNQPPGRLLTFADVC